VGQKVALVLSQGAKINPGEVLKMEVGSFGDQMRTTYTSEKGDCGGIVVNGNCKVVGIHFAEGDPGKNNLAIPIDGALLALFDSPKN
jgi:hypothetical protein